MKEPILIESFEQLVREARQLSDGERTIIGSRGYTDIPDGKGDLMLLDINVDPLSAEKLKPLTSTLCNNPPPEALCYLIAALCVLPRMALLLPSTALIATIRQGFMRAQVRTEMGWHDE